MRNGKRANIPVHLTEAPDSPAPAECEIRKGGQGSGVRAVIRLRFVDLALTPDS